MYALHSENPVSLKYSTIVLLKDLPELPYVMEPELLRPDPDHAPERDERRDDISDHELGRGVKWIQKPILV